MSYYNNQTERDRRPVHLIKPVADGGWTAGGNEVSFPAACGAMLIGSDIRPAPTMTPDTVLVTCGSCKRTDYFRRLAST